MRAIDHEWQIQQSYKSYFEEIKFKEIWRIYRIITLQIRFQIKQKTPTGFNIQHFFK